MSSEYNPRRRIYTETYGPIPKDSEGRTFDVHHKDSNPRNNNPKNLVAIPIYIHFIIHLLKREWSAAQRVAIRMKTKPELISELARKEAIKRYANGWQPRIGKYHSEETRQKLRGPFSEQHKQNLRKSHKPLSVEHKQTIRNAITGLHRSKETRQKMSQHHNPASNAVGRGPYKKRVTLHV